MSEIQELTEFLKLLSAETEKKFRETDRKFQEIAEERRKASEETDRKFQETDRELKEVGRYVREVSRNVNGIADSNGLSAEQFFSAALQSTPSLNGVSFDYAEPNEKRFDKNLNLRDQYDVVLYSDEAVGIVEIKYRLRSADIEELAGRKVVNFRLLFPSEAGKNIYLAAAGLSVDETALAKAKELGVYVMTQAGEGIKILNDEARVY